MNSEKPIFILGSHKSGTTLLRCLLDGHPELAVLPIETHTFAAAGFPVNYALRPSNAYKPRFETERFRERINDITKFYAETDDRKGDFVPKNYMDCKNLKKSIMQFSENTTSPKDKILAYWEHLFTTFELDSGNKRIVEKSVENFYFVEQLRNYFPDATFLHILRNPYRNVLSIRKTKYSGEGIPYLKPFVEAVKQSFEAAEKWKNSVSDYHLIKYEDILKDPSAFANKLSEILHIDYRASLSEPTVLDRKYDWEGNSVFKKSVKTIGETESHWREQLSEFEVRCINNKLGKYIENYEYDKINLHSITATKNNENWRAYIKNRLYYFNI